MFLAVANVCRYVNSATETNSYNTYYIKTPPEQTSSSYHFVSIRLKPLRNQNEMVLFASNGFDERTFLTIHYMAICIVNNRISFYYSSGPSDSPAGIQDSLAYSSQVVNNTWYVVNATYRDGIATLQVDDGPIVQKDSRRPGRSTVISLSHWTFLGIINQFDQNPIFDVQYGFYGCVSSFTLDNSSYHLVNDAIETGVTFSCENPCDLNDCSNNATCSPMPNDNGYYLCDCTSRYYGMFCERSYASMSSPCNSAPCRNDGTCVASGSSYTCQCLYPYYGLTDCDTGMKYIFIHSFDKCIQEN